MLQKWLHREIPENEQKIKRIAGEIEKIHYGITRQNIAENILE